MCLFIRSFSVVVPFSPSPQATHRDSHRDERDRPKTPTTSHSLPMSKFKVASDSTAGLLKFQILSLARALLASAKLWIVELRRWSPVKNLVFCIPICCVMLCHITQLYSNKFFDVVLFRNFFMTSLRRCCALLDVWWNDFFWNIDGVMNGIRESHRFQ